MQRLIIMKREQAIELATKMLLKIFNDDTEAVKTIILSKTAGDKEGAAVICSALIDMKQLIQELIDAIVDD